MSKGPGIVEKFGRIGSPVKLVSELKAQTNTLEKIPVNASSADQQWFDRRVGTNRAQHATAYSNKRTYWSSVREEFTTGRYIEKDASTGECEGPEIANFDRCHPSTSNFVRSG